MKPTEINTIHKHTTLILYPPVVSTILTKLYTDASYKDVYAGQTLNAHRLPEVWYQLDKYNQYRRDDCIMFSYIKEKENKIM